MDDGHVYHGSGTIGANWSLTPGVSERKELPRRAVVNMRGTTASSMAPKSKQPSRTTTNTSNRKRALQNAASRTSRSPVQAAQPPSKSAGKDASSSARSKRKRSSDVEQEYENTVRSQPSQRQVEATNSVVKEGGCGPWKRPRPHDPIQVAEDERLMEVVVATAANFEDPYKPVSLLWESIGLALGEPSGYGVQPRVDFLRGVWKDPSHNMHSAMTEKLKALVKSYVDARQRRNDVILRGLRTPPSSSRPSPEPETQAAGGAIASKPLPSLPNGRKAIDIDVELEEEVARIVLKHSPRFPEARSVVHVWQDIANDSRGRYNSRVIAQNRTLWLCKVASTPSHPKHYQLRPALRDMLLKILAHWNGVTSEEAIKSGDRRKVAKMTVDSKNDETLMSLVLEKRLFVETNEDRSTDWAEIIKMARHPAVQDSTTGIRRVLFLTRVFQHRSHEEHATLTERMRFLLAKYSLASLRAQERKDNGTDNSKANATHHHPQPTAVASESSSEEDDFPEEDDQDQTPQATARANLPPRREPTPEPQITSPLASTSASKPTELQHDHLVESLVGEISKLGNEQHEMQDKTQAAVSKLQEELRSLRDAHQQEMTEMRQLLEKERRERKQDLIAIMELVSKSGLPTTAYPPVSSSSDTNSNERCFI